MELSGAGAGAMDRLLEDRLNDSNREVYSKTYM
jgi:hypothetical protein